MFDLKRLTLILFLSTLASGACATLTLPNSDSSWSLDNEIGGIPLTIESTSSQSIVEPQALNQSEYDESSYQLVCLSIIDHITLTRNA
jgi:hypothetical protein